jgi:LSD1 subclass zinc finger protein
MRSLSKGRLKTSFVGSTNNFPYKQRSTHQLVTRVRQPARSGSDPDVRSTFVSCGSTKNPLFHPRGGRARRCSGDALVECLSSGDVSCANSSKNKIAAHLFLVKSMRDDDTALEYSCVDTSIWMCRIGFSRFGRSMCLGFDVGVV